MIFFLEVFFFNWPYKLLEEYEMYWNIISYIFLNIFYTQKFVFTYRSFACVGVIKIIYCLTAAVPSYFIFFYSKLLAQKINLSIWHCASVYFHVFSLLIKKYIYWTKHPICHVKRFNVFYSVLSFLCLLINNGIFTVWYV